MVLLIDNYDSFVYNLARYIQLLGFETTVVRNDAITLNEIALLKPSHIILSPGPCTPTEAGICLAVIATFGANTPILGVCLGHQAIGQAYGGNIVRAQQPLHGKATEIYHNEKGLFTDLPQPLTVGRYHSLIVSEIALPPELMVTARSAIGEIMALQHQHYAVFGVQFHPESILTQAGLALLGHFLKKH
jgi:para-aminobenzoate synthetase component II